MILSLQGKDNAKTVAGLEKIGSVTSSEAFISKPNGHKFRPGQELQLIGLEDYPEFNGETVVITSIRADGHHGKAYYFKTDNLDLESQLNWTYEYRLRNVYNIKTELKGKMTVRDSRIPLNELRDIIMTDVKRMIPPSEKAMLGRKFTRKFVELPILIDGIIDSIRYNVEEKRFDRVGILVATGEISPYPGRIKEGSVSGSSTISWSGSQCLTSKTAVRCEDAKMVYIDIEKQECLT